MVGRVPLFELGGQGVGPPFFPFFLFIYLLLFVFLCGSNNQNFGGVPLVELGSTCRTLVGPTRWTRSHSLKLCSSVPPTRTLGGGNPSLARRWRRIGGDHRDGVAAVTAERVWWPVCPTSADLRSALAGGHESALLRPRSSFTSRRDALQLLLRGSYSASPLTTVFAILCHMTYIFKKCPSKNFDTNVSNFGPD